MRFPAVIMSMSLCTSSALKSIELSTQDIKADSNLGSKLLSKARRLNDNEGDYTWVAGYSIKFQGCHHISQWNEEANGEDEPKIQTKRLVRFRLCPTGYCTYENAGGCESGYGDYIIDMNIFLEAYMQNKQEREEYECKYAEEYTCANCDNDYSCYDCLVANGMEFCVENNPYENNNNNNNNQDNFEIERYMECANWDVPNNNGRRLDDNEVEYFIGPYCADQGGKINLGVFTDEFCTNFADDNDNGYSHTEFYYKLTGQALPYSSESLVGMDCLSCTKRGENNNNNNNNNVEIDEMCEEVYRQAGKCESNIAPSSNYFTANANACSYIEGIKIFRSDGVVVQRSATKSKSASITIAVFSGMFILLGAYVYFLKSKLDRARFNLSE